MNQSTWNENNGNGNWNNNDNNNNNNRYSRFELAREVIFELKNQNQREDMSGSKTTSVTEFSSPCECCCAES